jgi:peptidoglycan/xylan/chitin deacetylase (PgdA/CDA1 family)
VPERRRRIGRGLLLVLACCCGALFAPAVAAAAPTIVSLTFDDGTSDQYQVRSMLAKDSLHATFYVNSDNIGSSTSFMTWNDLSGIAADGNEIAGHTLDHVDLTSVGTAEATRQVCDDRQAIMSHGFSVTDFAYPYGASNSTVESIVKNCGYSSARRAWGLCSVGLMPPNCNAALAETIPPQNIWEIRTTGVHAQNTLTDIEGAVTRAEDAGGGWVVLLFHHVCDGCDPTYAVSPAILSGFLDWLAPRSAGGTYVRTMSDVVGDTTPPTSSIACNTSACSSWYNQSVSVSLSATDSGTAVSAIRYTTDGTTPTTSSPLYTAPFTVSTTTTVEYQAWDMAGNVEATKSQLIQIDQTPPVSSIACNSAACSSSWYAPPVSVSLSAADAGGSGVAAIRYTTDGSDPTASSTLYTGPLNVSTSTTVKYRAWDTAGNVEATKSQLIQVDTLAPSVSITSPANGATLTGNVKIVAAATDAQTGVASVAFYVDGTLLGTTTNSPYQLPWNTRKAGSGTHTLTAVATDRAGNKTTSAAVTVTVR